MFGKVKILLVKSIRPEYVNMNDKQNSIEEEKFFDFSAIVDIFFRRRKIIIFSTSVLFSVFTINTLNNFFRNPIYQGSFSILIEDPIDTISTRSSSIEERLAANNTISSLILSVIFGKLFVNYGKN